MNNRGDQGEAGTPAAFSPLHSSLHPGEGAGVGAREAGERLKARLGVGEATAGGGEGLIGGGTLVAQAVEGSTSVIEGGGSSDGSGFSLCLISTGGLGTTCGLGKALGSMGQLRIKPGLLLKQTGAPGGKLLATAALLGHRSSGFDRGLLGYTHGAGQLTANTLHLGKPGLGCFQCGALLGECGTGSLKPSGGGAMLLASLLTTQLKLTAGALKLLGAAQIGRQTLAADSQIALERLSAAVQFTALLVQPTKLLAAGP